MRRIGYALIGSFGAQLFFFFTFMTLADTGVLRSLGVFLSIDKSFLPLIFWWTTGFGTVGMLAGFAVGHLRDSKWAWRPLTLADITTLVLILAVLLALGRAFYLTVAGALSQR